MSQNAKQLANQINKTLNDLGITINSRERATILSKMLDIPKQQAWSLLEGHLYPDDALLRKISSELEIELHSTDKK